MAFASWRAQGPVYMRRDLLKHMGVSKKSGTPKSSSVIGFSMRNHPFWGTPIFGNTYIGKLGV